MAIGQNFERTKILVPRGFSWAACVAGIALVLFPAIWFSRAHIVSGADDFLALYGGARLAGTSHLYDPAFIKQEEIQSTGMTGSVMLYIRLPWLALALWPLSRLPYVPAHAIWLLLRLVAVCGFILVWPYTTRSLTAIICCWSMPLALALTNGQDAPLLLLWLAFSERFQNSDRPFLAGAILALCTAKFHLFLLLPLLYLIHRRWLVITGFSVGSGVLLALSFVAAGREWPVGYFRVLQFPDISPSRWFMPNIHGFVPSGAPEWMAMAAVAAGAIAAMLMLDYVSGLAIALAGGLLLSYHAYFQDALVLIPAILIGLDRATALVRTAAGALATPIPWILMVLWRRP